MEQLQNILSQKPSGQTWEQLIECLDNWPDEDSFSTALDYAEQQLEDWPDYLRVRPSWQWKAIQKGVPIPPWWKLLRHLELGEHDNGEPLPIEAFINLTSIKFSAINLGSLEQLEPLTNLTYLELVDDSLPFSVEPLSKLKQLIYLTIAFPELEDIDGLEELKNLLELDLSYNGKLTDIESLASLSQLKWLSLEECKELTDLNPLSQVSQLNYLNLSGCDTIRDLSPLANLQSLTTLDLRHCNSIRDLSPLANLQSLTTLDLRHCNSITDLSPLASLTNCRIYQ